MTQAWHSTRCMMALLLPPTPPNCCRKSLGCMNPTSLCIHWNDDDGFVCSLGCNRSSCQDYCNNAVFSRRRCFNQQKVVVLKQLFSQRSPTGYCCEQRVIFMYDQQYRHIALIVPKHPSVLCTILAFVFEIQQYHLILQTPISGYQRVHYMQYFGCTSRIPGRRQYGPQT